MKATSLIAARGLEYAVNILKSAPSNATQWNEGYEFKCGQNTATISPEDKEKYFVGIHDLKSVIWSIRRIEALGGIVPARELLEQDKKALDKAYTSENYLEVNRLGKCIHDWESTYIRKGALVDVDFISESGTIYSKKHFKGSGVVDQFDGRNVFGRLNDGTPFMCFPEDVHIHGYEVNKHLSECEKLNRLG
ncbi:hypothetical protein [Acinetobacter modestus]|uniref:hypothetical protein n=1 Tax=Acinetobacter modestus TaxID=1776740 RepID=UPI00301642D0